MQKLLFFFLLIDCLMSVAQENKRVYDCTKKQLTDFYYDNSTPKPIPKVKKLPKGFSILLDPELLTKNFISDTEEINRIMLDTMTVDGRYRDANSKFEPIPEKQAASFKAYKKEYKQYLDSLHYYTNQGQQEIWLINNSRKAISIPTICGMPLLGIEALDKNNQWQKISLWQWYYCGGCIGNTEINPGYGICVIASLPVEGDFSTTFRLVFSIKEENYYSNEFNGAIDYCAFTNNRKK